MIRTITPPFAVWEDARLGLALTAGEEEEEGPSLLLSLGKTRTRRESLMSLPYPPPFFPMQRKTVTELANIAERKKKKKF